MKFKLIDVTTKNNYDFYNYTTKIINNLKEITDLGLIIDNNNISSDFFDKNSLINVVFFGGSNPKRYIKDVSYDESTNSLNITSNQEVITFSTMDFRMHIYLIVIDKVKIDKINFK